MSMLKFIKYFVHNLWIILSTYLSEVRCRWSRLVFFFSYTYHERKHLGPVTGISVDFDKIYVFCSKYCVCIDKCVFIIIKIKCVSSDRISDICDKVNFTTKLHIFYNTWQTFLSKYTQILQILTNLMRQSAARPKNFPYHVVQHQDSHN